MRRQGGGSSTTGGEGPLWGLRATGQRSSMMARKTAMQGFDQGMPQARLGSGRRICVYVSWGVLGGDLGVL